MRPRAQQRILVVDDEPALRTLMAQYLARLGYDVDACASAAEALERFQADPRAYWLVLADIVMPELSGRELIFSLLERNLDLRVLVTSGIPFHSSTLPPEFRARVEYLQKPFSPPMLAEAVRRLQES